MNVSGQSWLASAAGSQLVLIDIQTRLATAMRETDRARVVRNATILAKAAGLLAIPTMATEQYPKGLGSTESEVLGALPEGSPLLEKTCFACSADEGFRLALAAANRKTVILTGMEAHVCVLQTALELHREKYRVFVVEDAVCSRNPEHQRNAMERLRQAGVIVTNAESVIFEWLRDAKDPCFKNVSALIK